MNQNDNKFKAPNPVLRALKPLAKYDRYLVWYALKGFEDGATKLTVPKAAFMKQFGIDNGKEQRSLLKEAMRNMITKTAVVLEDENGEELDAFPLINRITLKNNQITMSRGVEAAELVLKLSKDNYTWLYIDQLIKLDGLYSPKFYQLARILLTRADSNKVEWEWHIDKTPTNKFESLKTWLDIEKVKAYENFYEIERRIIIPAISEINKKCSDCYIFYDPTENKRGAKNKVKSITLHISNTKPNDLETDLDIPQTHWYHLVPEAQLLSKAHLEKVAKHISEALEKTHPYNSKDLQSMSRLPYFKKGLLRYAILRYEQYRMDGFVIKNRVQYINQIVDQIFAPFDDEYDTYGTELSMKLLGDLEIHHLVEQKEFMRIFKLVPKTKNNKL